MSLGGSPELLCRVRGGEACTHDHERQLHHLVRPPFRLRNSSRVRGSSRISPCNAEVTVLAPAFCTPRNDMQRCSASRTTPTPFGSSCASRQSATCRGQALLQLQVTGEMLHHARELRQSVDPLGGQIGDVGNAMERQLAGGAFRQHKIHSPPRPERRLVITVCEHEPMAHGISDHDLVSYGSSLGLTGAVTHGSVHRKARRLSCS
jgi:hypothetical protein